MQCEKCRKHISDPHAMTVSGETCQVCYTGPHTKELEDIMAKLCKMHPILNNARFKALSEKATNMVLYFECGNHLARYVLLGTSGAEEYVCCMANCNDKFTCPVELSKDANLSFLRGEAFINGIKEVLLAFPTYKEGGCAFEYLPLLGMRSLGGGVWIGGKGFSK